MKIIITEKQSIDMLDKLHKMHHLIKDVIECFDISSKDHNYDEDDDYRYEYDDRSKDRDSRYSYRRR